MKKKNNLNEGTEISGFIKKNLFLWDWNWFGNIFVCKLNDIS